MRYRIWSPDGTGLSIGAALEREGHDVDFVSPAIKTRRYQGILAQFNPAKSPHADLNIFLSSESVAAQKSAETIDEPAIGAGRLNATFRTEETASSLFKTFGVKTAEPGQELAEVVFVQAWYRDGQRVPGSIFQWLQTDRLMAGDRGPRSTASMVLGQYSKRKSPPLFHHTIRKIEPLLESFKLSGPISACVAITPDNKIVCLGLGSSICTEATSCQLEALEGSLGRFLFDPPSGTESAPIPSQLWACSLRMTIPPHPYAELDLSPWLPPDQEVEIPGSGHYHPQDVYRDEEGVTRFCGSQICDVTAKATRLPFLENAVQQIAEDVKAPFLQYRDDIVGAFASRVSSLRKSHFI